MPLIAQLGRDQRSYRRRQFYWLGIFALLLLPAACLVMLSGAFELSPRQFLEGFLVITMMWLIWLCGKFVYPD